MAYRQERTRLKKQLLMEDDLDIPLTCRRSYGESGYRVPSDIRLLQDGKAGDVWVLQ